MAHKSGIERVGNMAHHAKAFYDIIKALTQGGWAAAAMQMLKHYWPQIIAVSAVLTLLPLIIKMNALINGSDAFSLYANGELSQNTEFNGNSSFGVGTLS